MRLVAFGSLLFLFPLFWLSGAPVEAGEADIVDVKVKKQSSGSYRFDVTVRHTDTGWKHYVKGWDVLSLDGRLLGRRTLYHPHVDEQPFVRSLSGVRIPAKINIVVLAAFDSVHGYGGRRFQVKLPR